MSLYKDPILTKIFTNLQASVTDGDIKEYFYGDPVIVPKSSLPCIIGAKASTTADNESNAMDMHTMVYVLTLVSDIRPYFRDGDDDVHVGYQILEKLIEERDTDYTLKTNTLLYILRNNHDLSNNAHIAMNQPILIDYGFTFGFRGENNWSMEAQVQVPVQFTQLR